LPFTVVDSNAFSILQRFNYGFTNITSVSVPASFSGTGGQTCTASAANPATPCLLASNFSPAVNGFGQQRRNQFTGPAQLQEYKATDIPRAGENIAQPCDYQALFPAGDRPVRAAWVTYDRGPDITHFYTDPEVLAFAKRNDLAMVLAI